MKKIINLKLVALILCAAPLSHASTPVSGPYIRAFAGFAFTPANNVNINNFSNPQYKTGYDAGGQFGYKSGPIRYEFEGTYSHSKLNEFQFSGVKQTSVTGKSAFGSLLLNVYYDFEDFSMSLAPYLSAGIGYSRIINTLNSTAPSVTSFNKSDTVFTYKAQAGLMYNFSENISTDIGYQYLRTKHSNRFNQYFQTHLVNFGMTYRYDR